MSNETRIYTLLHIAKDHDNPSDKSKMIAVFRNNQTNTIFYLPLDKVESRLEGEIVVAAR